MSFYIQHGYGKSTKIEDVASDSPLGGVVLSAGDEERTSLSEAVARWGAAGLRVLLDSQSYVYSASPSGAGRCHSAHGLDLSGMRWSQDAAATAAQVRAVREANEALGIPPPWIAPSVAQGTFTDVWTPLSLQLARTAIAEWDGANVIATVVIDEAALGDWQQVQDWLDIATSLEVAGFYILVDRHQRLYPTPGWDPQRLSNLLRMFYILGDLNGYEVTWGYADYEGLLGLASGASAMAAGWHYSLRNFRLDKWQPSGGGGGRPPLPRLSLPSLWVPVQAEAEGALLMASNRRQEIFDARDQARYGSGDFSALDRAGSQVQHMRALAHQAAVVAAAGGVRERLDLVRGALDHAIGALRALPGEGVLVAPTYLGRVESFMAALDRFEEAETL